MEESWFDGMRLRELLLGSPMGLSPLGRQGSPPGLLDHYEPKSITYIAWG